MAFVFIMIRLKIWTKHLVAKISSWSHSIIISLIIHKYTAKHQKTQSEADPIGFQASYDAA